MRDTSLETWRDIQKTGVLGAEQLKAYECLIFKGPMTGRELDACLGVDMHKRLSELERYGVVVCKGKRSCKVTGRMVYEWDVTYAMPAKPKPHPFSSRKKSLRKLLKEACEALEASGDLFAVAKAQEIRARIGGDS